VLHPVEELGHVGEVVVRIDRGPGVLLAPLAEALDDGWSMPVQGIHDGRGRLRVGIDDQILAVD
jgi:hypothetical protein